MVAMLVLVLGRVGAHAVKRCGPSVCCPGTCLRAHPGNSKMFLASSSEA